MREIPVMKPLLPTADKLAPYLRRIDASRYYSNHGPLLKEFEGRLAQHFCMTADHVMTVSNGTTALSAALLAVGAKAGCRCLVPSWTFVASAAAIWAANLKPHFVDVDEQTWMLNPEEIRRRSDLAEVGAVMVASAFGAPVDVASWDAFTVETGIPVVIDAAAGFDSVTSIPISRPRNTPVMISFHATKVFGIGEGAVILSSDETLVNRIRQICNFGVWGTGAQILGYNGKLSEYHAAVGLASLDGWLARRASVKHLTRAYQEGLASVPGVELLPGYGTGWVSSYCNIIAKNNAESATDQLRAAGIQTRRWWRNGVHAEPAYEGFSRDELPVTGELARRVFALPFYHDLTAAQIGYIVACLRSVATPNNP